MLKQVWVRVMPSLDPAMVGKEIVSKPGVSPRRLFTSVPELVELTSNIVRMINNGDLIEVEPPTGEE